MSSASHALRMAVFAALSNNAALAALLGGPKVFDDVPRTTDYPYIVLGDARFDDWSTATSMGHEHVLALSVYSRHGGRKEAQIIAAEVLHLLDGAPLILSGHSLINMRFTTAEVKREVDGKSYRAAIRLRAVTETNP